MAKKITIQMVGSSIDNQDVRLSEFIERLEKIKDGLRAVEKLITGAEKPALDYKIVGARHDSPTTIDLVPIAAPNAPPLPSKYADRVVKGFSTELRLIKKKGRVLRDPDIERLETYRAMSGAENSFITSIRITVDHNAVTVDRDFGHRIDSIIGPDEELKGSISGMLEAVNFHNTNKFSIYPIVGAKRVAGTFRSNLRPRVKEAIGNYVTVRGELLYKLWASFPHGIVAEDIEIHPAASDLPKLSEMRGAFPDLTEGEKSVDFLERIRNENW